mmetsp:Transcript_19384/g.43956  ORF Transcript_19384/g.43956 Transcript_19384/m.43956 type:complete len:332 (+) Transcript_19384:269-1264(+)
MMPVRRTFIRGEEMALRAVPGIALDRESGTVVAHHPAVGDGEAPPLVGLAPGRIGAHPVSGGDVEVGGLRRGGELEGQATRHPEGGDRGVRVGILGPGEVGELSLEGLHSAGNRRVGRVAGKGGVSVGAGKGRPGERPAVGGELEVQVPGLEDSRDEEAVGTNPVDGGALVVMLVERLLELADRIRNRDLAVGDKGKAAGGMEEGLGRGIGVGNEIHAEDGEGKVGNGDLSQDDHKRVLRTRGRPRGKHREGSRLEAGVVKGAGEHGAGPRLPGEPRGERPARRGRHKPLGPQGRGGNWPWARGARRGRRLPGRTWRAAEGNLKGGPRGNW